LARAHTLLIRMLPFFWLYVFNNKTTFPGCIQLMCLIYYSINFIINAISSLDSKYFLHEFFELKLIYCFSLKPHITSVPNIFYVVRMCAKSQSVCTVRKYTKEYKETYTVYPKYLNTSYITNYNIPYYITRM